MTTFLNNHDLIRRREAHDARQLRRLRKAAEAAGYKGMVGGWIYRVGTRVARFYAEDGETIVTKTVGAYKPVAQGWAQFERLYAAKIGFTREPFEG